MTERERQLQIAQIAARYAEWKNRTTCIWLGLCTECGEDLDKDERGKETLCRKCRESKED